MGFEEVDAWVRLLEVGASCALIAVLTLLAVLAFRDAKSIQGKLLTALALCLVALNSAELASLEAPDEYWVMVLRGLGVANVALFWLFCLSLLNDDFCLCRWHFLGAFVLALPPGAALVERLGFGGARIGWVDSLLGAIPFLMVVQLVYRSLGGLREDLVEPRRRARRWLVLALVTAAAVSLLTEYLSSPTMANLLRGAFSLPAALGLFFWLTSLDGDRLTFGQAASTGPQGPGINPIDLALHRRLVKAMEDQELFLEHRLSISELASRLEAPEHQLRGLINQGLGFRNFSTYLNRYRLNRAKALLADPQLARQTILRVALDSGFSSLQTFNRIFKQSEGLPPTSFRKQALAHLLAGERPDGDS